MSSTRTIPSAIAAASPRGAARSREISPLAVAVGLLFAVLLADAALIALVGPRGADLASISWVTD